MATVGHAYLKVLPSLQGLGRHLRDQIRTAESGAPAISLTAQVQTALLREQLRIAAREGDQTAVRLLAELDALPAQTRFQALLRQLSGQSVSVRVVVDRSLGTAVRGSLALSRGMGEVTASTTRAIAVTGAATLRYAALTAAVGGAVGTLGGLGSAAATASGALLLIPAAGLAAVAVVQTLRLGTEGLSEALAATDPVAFAAAVAGMPPPMRATAEAVRALRPEFTSLQLGVQERLFAGLAGEVSTLGARYLPILRTGTVEVADALNAGALGVGAFLREARTGADLSVIFGNSATAAGRLSGAVQPLLQALRDIAAVGSGFLPEFAGGLTDATQRFAAFVAQARASGQLQEWMREGLAALRELGTLLGNIAGIAAAVFRAANTSGASFLTTVNAVTGSVLAFLRSAEGQTALTQVFGGIAAIARGLDPILRALGDALTTSIAPAVAALGPQLGQALATTAGAVGPLAAAAAQLAPLAGAVALAFADLLLPASEALAPLFAELTGPLSTVAGLLAGAVGDAIRATTPAAVALARAAAPLLVQFAELAAGGLRVLAPILAQLLTQLAPVAATFGGAFLQAAQAALPVVAQLASLFGQTLLAGLRAVQPALPVLVELVSQLASVVSQGLAAATPTLVQIGQLVGELLVTAVSALAPQLPQLAEGFFAIVNAALPLLPPLLSLGTALLPPIIALAVQLSPVLQQAAAVFAQVTAAAVPLVEQLVRWLVPAIQALLGVVERVFAAVSSIISGALRYVQGVIDFALGLITGNWGRAWQGLRDMVGGVWDMVSGAVSNGIGAVVGLVRDLPGRILSVLGDLGNLLVEAGKNIIRGLIRGIEAAVQWLKDKLSWVTDLLPDWKGPPARDRVLLQPTGRMIMGGFLRGLEDGTPQVREYLTDLTDTLPTDPFPLPANAVRRGPPSAPAAGGGGVGLLGQDAWDLSAAVTAGVLAALDGARLRVDGAGVARLVNDANLRDARR
ncbi:phage-related protein [Actinokineospora baliensis]|uniref:phage tail protein n=1 Tax=Actinokineospora baliensis TaxID=547056 RepID=UPI00195B05D3|nr:hypothetical protein [Actinokineospora baliensis]MBM7771722.1 phage-related protein [Actinokineospora baliensis]